MKKALLVAAITLSISGCGDSGSNASDKAGIPPAQIEYQKKYIKAHNDLIGTKINTREREEKAKEMDAFLNSLIGTKAENWVCKYTGYGTDPKVLAEYDAEREGYNPDKIKNITHNGAEKKVVSVYCVEDNIKFKTSEGKSISAGFTLYLSLEQARNSEKLFQNDLIEISGESISANVNGWDWGYEGMTLINASYKILKKAK
jgi:hypothetical protein